MELCFCFPPQFYYSSMYLWALYYFCLLLNLIWVESLFGVLGLVSFSHLFKKWDSFLWCVALVHLFPLFHSVIVWGYCNWCSRSIAEEQLGSSTVRLLRIVLQRTFWDIFPSAHAHAFLEEWNCWSFIFNMWGSWPSYTHPWSIREMCCLQGNVGIITHFNSSYSGNKWISWF